MQPEQIVILVLSALVVLAGVIFAGQLLSGLANLKRRVQKVAKVMSDYGIPYAPDLLNSFVVGDVPGMLKEAEWIARDLSDPKRAAAALDAVLLDEIPPALSDPIRVTAVAKVIASWIAANSTAAASAGLAAVSPK